MALIEDEADPRMQAALSNIGHRLKRMMYGRDYSMQLDLELRQELYDFRNRCKAFGIDFPRMTFMVVPRLGAIGFYRLDLEPVGVRGAVVQFARNRAPEATPMELARAALWAWPHLKPTDFVDEGTFVVAHDRAKRVASSARARQEGVGVAETVNAT